LIYAQLCHTPMTTSGGNCKQTIKQKAVEKQVRESTSR
jgi:hypothetical protein